jgi:pimeloyl-ACP methyl ester carboxylesterase
MTRKSNLNSLKMLFALPVALYLLIVALMMGGQRKLLYFPSRAPIATQLEPWQDRGQTIGYCRRVPNPQNIWLMLHGNAGQAAQRGYVLPCLSDRDSFFVLEYPGYGTRPGNISLESLNAACADGFDRLRHEFPQTPVCVLGESIGSGPACYLASRVDPPAKFVLVVPFDTLANVAAEKLPFLPVRLILRDNWDNVRALAHYQGKVEIFAASDDKIIPFGHARRLAEKVPGSSLHVIRGGHNDWSTGGEVVIRN